MKNKSKKIVFYLMGLVLLMLIVSTVVFFTTSYKPTNEALIKLEDSNLVDVTEDGLIIFEPKNVKAETGLIIYPGAKVEPEAYAPLANGISEEGYLVVITPMPLNFAIFNSDAADNVISRFPQIKNWGIGGHSLGGVMAAKYASENQYIEGVVFYASYPQGDELKDLDIAVASIYGSDDGVASLDSINNSKELLPEEASFVEINGGNHAQFGSYGQQAGDNVAKISSDEQLQETIKATIKVLEKISTN